jgi:hypothetical protein
MFIILEILLSVFDMAETSSPHEPVIIIVD